MSDDPEIVAADEIPEELVITLRKPVKLGKIEYTELKLREPTAGEWEQWSKIGGAEEDIKAVSVVSGIPLPAVKMIGTRDLIAASRYLARFLV